MRLRVFIEPQQGATYDDQLRVARAAEDLGFDAFFRSDHYLKMGDGDGYPGSTDAWTTLAGLARETGRIRLGTLVSPATFRHPGPLAITVAQVDQMSAGRVELGLGAGWFAAEHAAYGLDFPALPERYDLFAEQLAVIDGLWRTPVDERFSFAGTHYQVTDSPALPKPVQSPRVPIVLGGAGKQRSAALAARYADEYNVGFSTVTDTATVLDRVRTAVAEAGRGPDSIRYSSALVVCAGSTGAEVARRADAIGRTPQELAASGLAGSPAAIVEKIATYAEIGIDTLYLQVLDLADLDHLELIAAEVLAQV
ncbi:LLM class F420-dependent oxidoreductase [soil metagenome]